MINFQKVIKSHNKKKEESENKILNETARGNDINVREHENVSVMSQSNNKVDIIKKQLIESKRFAQDLTIGAERVCLECENCKIILVTVS